MKEPLLDSPARLPLTTKRAVVVTLLCLTAFFLSSCSELRSLRLQKADHIRRIDELEKELETISSTNIDTLRKQNDTIKSLQANLETTKSELHKALTQRTKNERELEKTTNETLLKFQAQTNELKRYKELDKQREEEFLAKRAENQGLQQSIDDLKAQATTLETDLEKTRLDFNKMLKIANDKESELNSTILNQTLQLESSAKASSNLNNSIDSQKATLLKSDATIKALTTELATEKKRTTKLEENVKSFEAQIRNFNEALKKASSDQTNENPSLKKEKIALEKEMLQFQKQIEILQKGETVIDADLQEALNLLKVSLQPLDDANFASVLTDSRGVIVRLSADFLFKTGTVNLDPQVLATLDQIAEILSKYDRKYIEIQGHTDSQNTERMPFVDNWALASARADKVVRYFASHKKIDPKRLKSTSCAQYRPPEDKSSKTRRMLRRVDIILTPNP